MPRPSLRRTAAALALACLALLLPIAGHAAPRSEKTSPAATLFERALSGLLDRFAILRPGGTVSKRGSSIDPNGATSESDRGSSIDPDGATSDSGSGLDLDGRT